MQALFTTLTDAVGGNPAVALGAALLWGVLSIVLSPCHLASIPLMVGFINGQGEMPARRAFTLATLFSVGILATIAAIGAATAAAGRLMGDVGAVGNYVVAGIFLIIGLHLMDVIKLPLPGPARTGTGKRGAWAALGLGLVFGIALGPCTFAFMAPMLAMTFAIASTHLWYGILLLFFYGIGHCAVIIAAGTSTRWVQRYLNWSEQSRGTALVRRICGLLVALAGLYLIYVAP